MRDLGLHHTGRFGRQKMLLRMWLEDRVSKGAFENADTSPDAGLRRVTTSKCTGNRSLGELGGAMVGDQARRKRLQGRRAFPRPLGARATDVEPPLGNDEPIAEIELIELEEVAMLVSSGLAFEVRGKSTEALVTLGRRDQCVRGYRGANSRVQVGSRPSP